MTAPMSAAPAATFTAELWESIESIFRVILDHPFLTGLTDGTLPEETFRFYVTQDSLYLRDYSRCLAVAAAKAPRDEWCEMFAGGAQSALFVERALHEGFFEAWGLPREAVEATPMSPTNLAYTSYLTRTAYAGSFEELVGAMLPCYWIYWEVGKALVAAGSPNPLYQRWIDKYASEEFGEAVRRVLDATNRATADLPETRLAPIRRRFLTASRYEWMFWDSAYRREAWPV